VPLAPGLEWREHATASAHVTESGLAGSVGSAAANTRDTRNSATGSPRLGTSLLTGNLLDTMSLTGVLAQVRVHKVDKVRSDGSLEDGWGGHLTGGVAGLVVDGYLWASCRE